MKKKECYIYTRVSTSMQVDGYSLDAVSYTHLKWRYCALCEVNFRTTKHGSFAEFHSVQEGFPLAPLDAAIFPVNRLHQQAVFFMPVRRKERVIMPNKKRCV